MRPRRRRSSPMRIPLLSSSRPRCWRRLQSCGSSLLAKLQRCSNTSYGQACFQEANFRKLARRACAGSSQLGLPVEAEALQLTAASFAYLCIQPTGAEVAAAGGIWFAIPESPVDMRDDYRTAPQIVGSASGAAERVEVERLNSPEVGGL